MYSIHEPKPNPITVFELKPLTIFRASNNAGEVRVFMKALLSARDWFRPQPQMGDQEPRRGGECILLHASSSQHGCISRLDPSTEVIEILGTLAKDN